MSRLMCYLETVISIISRILNRTVPCPNQYMRCLVIKRMMVAASRRAVTPAAAFSCPAEALYRAIREDLSR